MSGLVRRLNAEADRIRFNQHRIGNVFNNHGGVAR
jgi:hypothetical protein